MSRLVSQPPADLYPRLRLTTSCQHIALGKHTRAGRQEQRWRQTQTGAQRMREVGRQRERQRERERKKEIHFSFSRAQNGLLLIYSFEMRGISTKSRKRKSVASKKRSLVRKH